MRRFCSFIIAPCVMVLTLGGGSSVYGDTLFAGFENTLETSVGASFGHVEQVTPTIFNFTSVGATEGTTALEVTHPQSWITDIQVIGGQPLAELTAASTLFQFDVTTEDRGVAGDALHPAWRQVFAIFNGNVGGWQQTQLDFAVAADDGQPFTTTVFLDLISSGIAANAAQAAATWGDNSYWELYLVFQGADSDSMPQIETIIDNMRFDGEIVAPPELAGDYNDDGTVDAADYTVWRDNIGGTMLANETASPGVVDTADYDEWLMNFGATGGGGLAAAVGVPEPAGLALLLITMATLIGFSRLEGR